MQRSFVFYILLARCTSSMFRRLLKWFEVVFVPLQDVHWLWKYCLTLILNLCLKKAHHRFRGYLLAIIYDIADQLRCVSWKVFLFRLVTDYLSSLRCPSQLFVNIKDHELRRIEGYRAMRRQVILMTIPIKFAFRRQLFLDRVWISQIQLF